MDGIETLPLITAAVALLGGVAVHARNSRSENRQAETISVTEHIVLHLFRRPHFEWSKSKINGFVSVLYDLCFIVSIALAVVAFSDAFIDWLPKFKKEDLLGNGAVQLGLTTAMLFAYCALVFGHDMIKSSLEAFFSSNQTGLRSSPVSKRQVLARLANEQTKSKSPDNQGSRVVHVPELDTRGSDYLHAQEKIMPRKIQDVVHEAWLPAGRYTRETLPPPPASVKKLLSEIGYDELVRTLEAEPENRRNKLKIMSRQRKSVRILSRSPRVSKVGL